MSPTKKSPKISKIFECVICNYTCCKQSEYNKHILTRKHKILQNPTSFTNPQLFACKCGKVYKHSSTLYAHKKHCFEESKEKQEKQESMAEIENNITPELIIEIIKQNQEFKDLLLEQNKTIIEMSKNSSNIINSHNKTFNLQLFLNETCKDAMNIMDFVDSIKFQLSDLESVGELGYVNGLSKIIIRNLKALDENMRPVHCSDLKREKIYVKDADKWEKEGADNKILKNAIKYIAHKNVKMIPAFREKYPDCIYSDSRKSDQYNKLIIEAMGGEGNDEDGKANRIIKKIAKEILIEK